jgi:hypothetical protein
MPTVTSPPQEITVQCPQCGQIYKDWWRPSINLSLGERFSDEYLEEASTSTCPTCHYKVRHSLLVIRENGLWQIGPRDAEDD